MSVFRHKRGRGPGDFARGQSGAAAVELVLVLGLLTIPLLNVVDLAFYAFTWMQTQNAAQMAGQAAFSDCNNQNDLPAATRCFGTQSANNLTLYDVVNQGIDESALGNTVTLTNAQVVDGYFCSTAGNVLTQVGTLGFAYNDTGLAGASPSNSDVMPIPTNTCGAGYQDGSAVPGEYVKVTVTHTYTSIFPYVSVVALLPSVMTATAYARLD
ncbi:MAG TPA: TadE/TadG family type IV pilus assembly protein [Caulobacteraceae bacterium]